MIEYRHGDATLPVGEGRKYLVHISNNQGGWGAGFTGALSRYPLAMQTYLAEAKKGLLRLGDNQYVEVGNDLCVVNMIAQNGFPSARNRVAVDYDALCECLSKVAFLANVEAASIHMPKIGAGIGGGDWEVIEQIINEEMGQLDVTVYLWP